MVKSEALHTNQSPGAIVHDNAANAVLEAKLTDWQFWPQPSSDRLPDGCIKEACRSLQAWCSSNDSAKQKQDHQEKGDSPLY